MSALFIYLRNITYYLMFAAVVGMLAPQGKYKKFVSLVMGFILLSIMIAPLARFSGEIPVTDWFSGLAHQSQSYENLETSYANWRNTYFHGAFEAQLATQLTNLLTQNGFEVHDAHITFLEDFTALTGVQVTVSEREETPQRVPFIRIQPVQVSRQEEPEACTTSTAVKNLISEFYNLSQAHINVTVR